MDRLQRAAALAATYLFLTLAVTPALAFAAQWDSIDVISHDEGSQSVLLVSGTLPDGATLPAEVTLPVPSGLEMQWAGEILGGAPQDDPEVTTTKSNVDGADVYAFTLTKSRIGQVEVIAPAAGFDGRSTYMSSIAWVSDQAVPEVRVSARVPRGSTIGTPVEGAALEPGPEGFSYYTKTFKDVKPGDKAALAFTYTAPAAPAATAPGAAAPASPVVPIVIFLVVVAVGATFFVKIAQKVSGKTATTAPDPAADDPDADTDADIDADIDADTGADTDADIDAGAEADADADTDADVAVAPARGFNPVVAMVGALLLVVVVAFVVIGQSSKPQLVEGTLTRAFGGVGACTSTTLALAPVAGVDLAANGDKLIDSLGGVESIGQVTLSIPDSRITVEFCDSSTNEQAIKDALAATGLVSW